MTNGNDLVSSQGYRNTMGNPVTNRALTKREYFAARMLQPMMPEAADAVSLEACANWAVRAADMLIVALNADSGKERENG